MSKTAGIIIIGDEILSGKIQDDNSFFMARELWSHGIRLCRISVIPDAVDVIAEEVRDFSEKFDYVFTSGGIGPTHDDVTIEGISKAYGTKPVIDPTLRDLLQKKQGHLTPEQLKMAEVPDGSELVDDGTLSFPLIKFRNIFIFPGIPPLLRRKFFAIEKSFREPAIHLKKIYLNESESLVAPVLNETVKRYENVKIGSYPAIEQREYSVMITLESLHVESLNLAAEDLLRRIPAGKLVRVE
jgi:molybdenum cofactor synthesis domain-containing protein